MMFGSSRVYTTQRLYWTNAAAPYTPATFKGGWGGTASAVAKYLSSSTSGATANVSAVKGMGTSTEAYFRFISDGLVTGYNFSGSTVDFCVGGNQSYASGTQTVNVRIFIYLTTGDSDTNRGTLLNYTGTVNWTNGVAQGYAVTGQALSAVTATALDRICVELGFSYNTAVNDTVTMYYGNTGSTLLTNGSTNVTTEPGWILFSRQLPLA